MDEEQLIEMIVSTKGWYDGSRDALKQIIEQKDHKIKFQGEDGNQVELPEEHMKGFRLGILTALEVFGNFPINISND